MVACDRGSRGCSPRAPAAASSGVLGAAPPSTRFALGLKMAVVLEVFPLHESRAVSHSTGSTCYPHTSRFFFGSVQYDLFDLSVKRNERAQSTKRVDFLALCRPFFGLGRPRPGPGRAPLQSFFFFLCSLFYASLRVDLKTQFERGATPGVHSPQVDRCAASHCHDGFLALGAARTRIMENFAPLLYRLVVGLKVNPAPGQLDEQASPWLPQRDESQVGRSSRPRQQGVHSRSWVVTISAHVGPDASTGHSGTTTDETDVSVIIPGRSRATG